MYSHEVRKLKAVESLVMERRETRHEQQRTKVCVGWGETEEILFLIQLTCVQDKLKRGFLCINTYTTDADIVGRLFIYFF